MTELQNIRPLYELHLTTLSCVMPLIGRTCALPIQYVQEATIGHSATNVTVGSSCLIFGPPVC